MGLNSEESYQGKHLGDKMGREMKGWKRRQAKMQILPRQRERGGRSNWSIQMALEPNAKFNKPTQKALSPGHLPEECCVLQSRASLSTLGRHCCLGAASGTQPHRHGWWVGGQQLRPVVGSLPAAGPQLGAPWWPLVSCTFFKKKHVQLFTAEYSSISQTY